MSYLPTPTVPLFRFRAGDRPAGAIFSRGGPGAQLIEASAFQNESLSPGWLRVDNAVGFICVLGDSIPFGAGSPLIDSFAPKTLRSLAPKALHFGNLAVSSARLSYSSDATLDVFKIYQSKLLPLWNNLPGVVVVMAGTNDLYLDGASAATTFTRLTTLTGAIRVSHPKAKIIVVTPLPRQNNGGFETVRQAYRSSINGGNASYDYAADWGGDSTMCANAAASTNTTYYDADQIHPKDAGHAIGATYLATQLTSAFTALGV